MAETPFTPGVQIKEVPLGAPPIFGVGTSTAGFVGVAPKPKAEVANRARLVTSEDEFVDLYVQDATRSNDLSRAVTGFFRNGGVQCYVVHVAAAGNFVDGLKLLESIDEVAILAVPGSNATPVYKAMQDQAESIHDRFAILDPPPRVTDFGELKTNGAKRPPKSMFSAFYYPRIEVPAYLHGDPEREFVPPSGHLAGVYARVDIAKGVHKAPANERLRGVIGLEHQLTDQEQNGLNEDTVNVVRNFSGEMVVWGARTLVGAAASGQELEYRYVSTRRFVNFVEETLKIGLRFAVFEPNNLPLRQTVARSISGFLDGCWRDGALFGETPSDSYYVKFPPLFNRPEDQKAGKLVVEVGLRISYPAEFIVIRIGPLDDSPNA